MTEYTPVVMFFAALGMFLARKNRALWLGVPAEWLKSGGKVRGVWVTGDVEADLRYKQRDEDLSSSTGTDQKQDHQPANPPMKLTVRFAARCLSVVR